MEQFLYTLCSHEESLFGGSGQQIMAATPGLDRNELNRMVKHAAYLLPGDYSSYKRPGDFPRRFGRITPQSGGSLVINSTYLGKDPTSGRPGHFISHVLVTGEGDSLDALDIFNLWQAPFWITEKPARKIEMPQLPRQGSGHLTRQSMQQFLEADPRRQEWLSFLVRAYLSLESHKRVFIACPAEEAIWWCYGIAALLPRTYTRDMTFSTFERNMDDLYSRVVCTSWSQPIDDLPSVCYGVGGFGLNTYTGRHEPEPKQSQYVADAVTIASDAKRLRILDDFLPTTEGVVLSEPAKFDIVWKAYVLFRRENNTDGLLPILKDPEIGIWVLNMFKEKILKMAYKDPDVAKYLKAAISRPGILTASILGDEFKRLMDSGEISSLNAIHGLIKDSPEAMRHFFKHLWATRNDIAGGKEPHNLKYEFRKFLVEGFIGITDDYAALEKWLTPPKERPERMIDLNIPINLHTKYLFDLERKSGWPEELVRALVKSEDLALAVLALAHESGSGDFIRISGQYAQAGRSLLPLEYLKAKNLSKDENLLVPVLGIAFTDDERDKVAVEMESLWETIHSLSGQGKIDFEGVAKAYLTNITIGATQHPRFTSILTEITKNETVSSRVRQVAENWLKFTSILNAPSTQFEPLKIAGVCLEYGLKGNKEALGLCVQKWLSKRPDGKHFTHELDSFAGRMGFDWSVVFETFLERIQNQPYQQEWAYALGLALLNADYRESRDASFMLKDYLQKLTPEDKFNLDRAIFDNEKHSNKWSRWMTISGIINDPLTTTEKAWENIKDFFTGETPLGLFEIFVLFLILASLFFGLKTWSATSPIFEITTYMHEDISAKQEGKSGSNDTPPVYNENAAKKAGEVHNIGEDQSTRQPPEGGDGYQGF